jgi:hypothetical protein
MKLGLIVALAALGLSACAEGYGYAYDYDPYLGVRGHYVGPFEGHRPRAACQHIAYEGPYPDGYRGAYDVGPYCLDRGGQAWVAVAR